ncbi:MAG: hypothetical protein WBB67_12045 [bacterium]
MKKLKRSMTTIWLIHYLENKLIPGIKLLLSPQNQEKWLEEHPDSKCIYINVEEILRQSEDQNVIEITGSAEDWSRFRVIYKDVEIPYSSFWHRVQDVVMGLGFQHIAKARYRYEIAR